MRAILSATVLLAACQPAPADPPPPATSTTGVTSESDPDAPGVPAPASLIGDYRVAGVDGAAVDLEWGMSVSINATTIRLVSQCVTPQWRYRYEGGAITTESMLVEICEREMAPAEAAANAALDGAEQVTRTPENGLEITGGGHSITLFSQ